MRKNSLLLLLAVFAFFSITGFSPAFNSSLFKVNTGTIGRGMWQTTITRSGSMAASAIDTVFVDVKDLLQGQAGNAATGGLEITMFFDGLATGDSLTCSMFPSVNTTDVKSLGSSADGISSFQVTGGAASTVTFAKAIPGPAVRYFRFIITNNQGVNQPGAGALATGYKVIMQGLAAP